MLSVKLLLRAGTEPSPDKDRKVFDLKKDPTSEVESRDTGGGHEEDDLEGKQQRPPFFTPQVRQDGCGHDGERQAHQDPDLTKKRVFQLPRRLFTANDTEN